MKRAVTIAGLLGSLSFASVVSPTSARANNSYLVEVTSRACGSVTITNHAIEAGLWLEVQVDFATGTSVPLFTETTRTVGNLSAGTHTVKVSARSQGEYVHSRIASVSVAPCNGTWPRLPVEGDQNGDRRADVLGIQAQTGDLYYYRMTTAGLASGIKAGTGWNNMVFMRQVNGFTGSDAGKYLIAVRKDGTVWRYDNRGAGRFANGTQIGSGLTGYSNFAISSLSFPPAWNSRTLLATKDGQLYGCELTRQQLGAPVALGQGWQETVKLVPVKVFQRGGPGELMSITTDGSLWRHTAQQDDSAPALQTPVKIGRGWTAMQTVASPGSLDGDALDDLVARRSDGNLYKYLNQGGHWGPATKIGQNWQRIRLLA
ncbi:hypothetical protein [Luteococcus sp. OSA5]|uniref:hypothetical protein n=1 Tax=Luteococcus sp. OSA5 TaxID=3401630 RepID=UPI003B43C1BF